MSDTKKPVSAKQLAANRANAARSTGPRTPEGKARSARNAIKHGFTASSFTVIRIEDLQEIARLKEDLVSVYQPVNAQEMFALERMALAQQSILRAARLEAGLFTAALNRTIPSERAYLDLDKEISEDIDVTVQQHRNFALAEGFRENVHNTQNWTLFLRYQAQAERLDRRALEDFERLERLRPQLPNEPILESQPEEEQALFKSKDEPFGTYRRHPSEPAATPYPTKDYNPPPSKENSLPSHD